MIQKKFVMQEIKKKKCNNKGRIPKKTKMMKFTAKVERLALDGWDMFPTLTGVKVEYSNHYIICRAQRKTCHLLFKN